MVRTGAKNGTCRMGGAAARAMCMEGRPPALAGALAAPTTAALRMRARARCFGARWVRSATGRMAW